jgi:hypothetical protein
VHEQERIALAVLGDVNREPGRKLHVAVVDLEIGVCQARELRKLVERQLLEGAWRAQAAQSLTARRRDT